MIILMFDYRENINYSFEIVIVYYLKLLSKNSNT
jgi:hypothetical protein